MHKMTAPLALLFTLALLAPTAQAQITFTSDVQNLSFEGNQTLEFSASVDCDAFVSDSGLTGQGTMTETVDFTLPEGFTGDASTEVEFNGAPCLTGGDPTANIQVDNITVNITPGPAVPGMTGLSVGLTSGESTGSINFQVDYRPGYFFDVSQTFPVDVTKDEDGNWIPVTWTATITVTANADTMVMMQVNDKIEYGTLAGLFANSPHNFLDLTSDQIENGITKTVAFSYTPTSDNWEEDTISFVTWSHYLPDNTQGQTADQEVTWTFHNGAAHDDEDGFGIPGFGFAPAILALLGAALVAARRRD